MSPAAESVIRRLDSTRQQWWLFTLLTSAVSGGCLSFAVLLVFMLSDSLVKFSQLALSGMFLIWLTVTVALVVMVCRRLVRSQRSLEATARRMEAEFPELGSNLINLVQLSEDIGNLDRRFCHAAVDVAAAEVGRVPLERAAGRESRWRRFLCCMQTPRDLSESFAVLGVLIAVAIVCHMLIPNWGSAAGRLLTPWQFVPSVGSVKIVKVTPGDTEVLVGTALAITAEIENPEANPYKATLWITPAGGEESALPMAPDKKHRHYRLTLPSVLEPLAYRLEIGDSQTKLYTVGVRQKPTIEEVEVAFHYPRYLGRRDETFAQKQADLEAPQYTIAELRIRPSVPIAKGCIRLGERQFPGRVEQSGMRLIVPRLPMVEDGTFTVHMENDAGHGDVDPRVNRIRIVPDRPPTVQLLKPSRHSSASAGSEIAVMIRGGDDHGLGRVRLEMKRLAADGTSAMAGNAAAADVPSAAKRASDDFNVDEALPITTVKQWDDLGGAATVVLHHQLLTESCRRRLPSPTEAPTTVNRRRESPPTIADPKHVQPGQVVLVRAVAWDKRNIDISEWGLDLRPQRAAGPWHAIRIVDPRDEAAAALAQLESLQAAIYKILISQLRARVDTARITKAKQPAGAVQLAGRLHARQVDIQKATLALVAWIGKTDKEERLMIKRILNRLAFGDMLEAVRQCDAMTKIKSLDDFARPAGELDLTQDRIVDLLRKLLDVTRRAHAELLAEMKKRPGGDLPDDTEKLLEEMRNKLEEFLKQQKRVVEATENLAKTPVEDFSEEEEQLLKEMAAGQDEWSRLMKEFHSDLSKLPEQDFSNPSMLDELVEIQTELKMAEDALLKKTADIAVPIEQLGAEMAEEILTHMEKWLPDTADRERWSQEEYLDDEGKEAPMAELPGELEDLIGELAEEEEDLFDEMEDVSSSAMDSLDKGAGWDAMDGPISNMSAAGVTGNRLPNTSEMGGRSGEGRSGKSSGEFVGNEAIGKGGRKTPSRLTADPFEKGQVKDHSRDPVGGATGGGKESGQGGDGLEGPQRRSPGQRNLQRLAGKQAALRNRAEAIDLQFRVMNFHHTDLKKMIDAMAQIERDLIAGRYQNALRQRKVLAQGLGNVKQYLEGEFHVRRDETVNLPTDIQKEILGGMQDPSPLGWEELNRQYYRRLSTGGVEESSK